MKPLSRICLVLAFLCILPAGADAGDHTLTALCCGAAAVFFLILVTLFHALAGRQRRCGHKTITREAI